MSAEEKPVEPQAGLPAVRNDGFLPIMTLKSESWDSSKFITNFSGQGVKAAEFITQALAKDGHDIRTFGDRTFPAKYYLAHVADFVAPDGEILPMPRMVLIAPDGQTLSFVSEGAIRSMDLIRSLCGDDPWDPPLQISVVPRKTRRGFFTYRLVLGGILHASVEEEVSSQRNQQAS